MPTYFTAAQQEVTTGREVGSGGEGSVYEVAEPAGYVAKIYHPQHRTAERELKLKAMLSASPEDDALRLSTPHISIAWPVEILYEQGKFLGFLMPRVGDCPCIFEVYNPLRRAQQYPDFDWRYLHRVAKNLATALNALHAAGYVVGDVNQKNVLVTESALVTLIDTDSFQVRDAGGKIYRCTVGVPEYVPAELQGTSLDSVDRRPEQDIFGLAVMIFQTLMEGFHPFTGAPRDQSVSIVGEIYLHCIKNGTFPYQDSRNFSPPPGAPAFKTLHPELRHLLQRCFVDGHVNPLARPSAREWIDALDAAEESLTRCPKYQTHWYSSDYGRCQWCEREEARPKPLPQPSQQALPALTAAAIPSVHQPQAPLPPAPAAQSRPAHTPRYGILGVIVLLLLGAVLLIALTVNKGSRGTPGPEPANAPAKAETAYVNTLQLNVRSGPGSEFGALLKLSQGDSVTCLDKQLSSDGGSWTKVRVGSTEGWVNGKLLSADKPTQLSIQGDNYMVSLGKVGGVQVVGLTVQQASTALGRRLIKGHEITEGCSYAEPEGGRAGVAFMVINGKIARIDLTDARVPYEGSIRVGDTQEKVKSIYKGRLKIEPHAYDEKGHYLEVKEGNYGVVFETDGKHVMGIRSGKAPEYQYVEGCL